MRLRLADPYWTGRRHAQPARSRLRGQQTADVIIIGGGITGCVCAWMLARRGLDVVLIDKARIARGSTAASTALLMQEPDTGIRDLADRYGHAVAARMWHASRGAVADLTAALRRIRGTTGLRHVPSLYLAGADDAGDVRRELAARHRAGLRGRWLGAAAVHRTTGLTAGGAILTHGNAVADPLAACLAFAHAAGAQGARVFEYSAARRVRVHDDRVVVSCPEGRVTASRVIVATGYATQEFRPLAGRFRLATTTAIATERLTAAQRRAIGLREVMWWDTGRPYHYARWTPDHRLIFGGRDRALVGRSTSRSALLRATRDALLDDLVQRFPALHGIRADYAWEGLFASTPDGLPYIGAHRRYPRHLFALGYGGNGMSFGYLAADILTRMLTGESRDDDTLFAFDRARVLARRR